MAVEYDDLMAMTLKNIEESDINGPITGGNGSTQPIIFLGSEFKHGKSQAAALKERITALPWFTYRRGFPRIGPTTFQSDQGWGCMLRCGQMILAESLFECRRRSTKYTSKVRREVMSGFADEEKFPYSIHNVALRGSSLMNKDVGAWFGPNCMAQVIRSLCMEHKEENFAVHVGMDGYVCIEDVVKINPIEQWKPLLLLVPLRLGLDEMNAKYGPSVKRFFEMEQCVGAIGGRPNAAYYFVGYRGNSLLFLDPHKVQPSVGEITKHVSIESYTSHTLDQIPLLSVDPSFCLGFLCHTHADFTNLVKDVNEMNESSEQGLFTIVEKDLMAGLLSDDDDFSLDDDQDGHHGNVNISSSCNSNNKNNNDNQSRTVDNIEDDDDDDDCGFEVISIPGNL
eukprot:m.79282 g.79282  ORF g.79282 m.79282 type:complete len:396 (-) comp25201_c0_seq1:48-1235(-)